MATMDITPQELRDIEIREAWRGYHRDDVDELLERAASTIEHLEAENAQLRSRGPQGAPAPAPTPAPQPARIEAPAPPPAPAVRTADTDVIQRTLVLAQKAADEAVAEAKARAGQIVSESESRAQQLVADAEANARRIADTEKAKLEDEIAQLMSARDTLTADCDALERFEAEYRERLRTAIQAEMDLLQETHGVPAARPQPSEIQMPAPSAPAAASAEPEPSWSASQESVPAPPEPAHAPAPPSAGPATVHIDAVAAYDADPGEQAWDPAPAGGWDAPNADDSAELDLRGDLGDDRGQDGGDPEHGDSLDDDAFFASLREAVRDDAPLGSGHEGDDTAFFDQDDTDEHRRLFKRRR